MLHLVKNISSACAPTRATAYKIVCQKEVGIILVNVQKTAGVIKKTMLRAEAKLTNHLLHYKSSAGAACRCCPEQRCVGGFASPLRGCEVQPWQRYQWRVCFVLHYPIICSQ